MKKIIMLLLVFILILISLSACVAQQKEPPKQLNMEPQNEIMDSTKASVTTEATISIVNKDGTNIEDRFLPPEGFERVKTDKGTFADYLRTLPLKPYGAKVHYYDGQEKLTDVHEAVVDMDIGNRDLQQCADAVMRLRAEYLYMTKQYDKIHFNLTNGFRTDFSKWINGNRVVINKNKAYWVKKSTTSNSYKSFRNYMDFIFAYAGTLSLDKELKKVPIDDMQIGDVFIKGGSPGHCVIIVDMAENRSNGEKIFMLAQSYMPAQEIHILKNYQDENISPWYSIEIIDTLETPEWTFAADSLKRFED